MYTLTDRMLFREKTIEKVNIAGNEDSLVPDQVSLMSRFPTAQRSKVYSSLTIGSANQFDLGWSRGGRRS